MESTKFIKIVKQNLIVIKILNINNRPKVNKIFILKILNRIKQNNI